MRHDKDIGVVARKIQEETRSMGMPVSKEQARQAAEMMKEKDMLVVAKASSMKKEDKKHHDDKQETKVVKQAK